jgi:hypothetical protein
MRFAAPIVNVRARILVAGVLAAAGLALNAALGPPPAKAICNPDNPDCGIVYEYFSLDVNRAGNGSGSVTGGGISCGTTCTKVYRQGTTVVLTATAAAGSTFSGWSGCPSPSGSTCTVTMAIDRNVTATFTRGPRLTVANSPSSGGSVTSSDGAISCGSTCAHTYPYGSTPSLTLYAWPAAGYRFTGWSGCPQPFGTRCILSLSGDRSVTANYVRRYTVTIDSSPAGNGGVITVAAPASAPPGSCATPCSVTVDAGTTVKVSASNTSAWAFTGWSGCPAASGSICSFAVGADTNVIANFLPVYTLTVNVSGAVNGSVVSGPGWSCSSSCTYSYTSGTQVSLVETTGSHDPFVGWGGACAGAGSSAWCGPLTITGDVTVSATFDPELHTLTTTRTGNGGVAGPGWTCGTTCTHTYAWGTSVELTPAPGADSVLSSWTGCDSVDPVDSSCTVALTSDRTVSASYVLKQYTLTVTAHGKITGPNGIDCGSGGSVCTAQFTAHTSVSLAATADAGYRLDAWTSACSGSGGCTVTMDGDRTVGATFVLQDVTLTVVVSPSNGGMVISNIGGITCGFGGSVCTATYPATTVVQLSALAAAGFAFGGWSANCPGGQCVLNSDTTVTASFN